MRVGRIMRLAKKIVRVYEIVTQNEPEKVPVERRDTNFINGEKVSIHDAFYYLQCWKPNVLIFTVLLLTARWYGELPSVSGLA